MISLPHSKCSGEDLLAAMRKPFLLLTAIFIASVVLIAQVQPPSPAGLVESKTATVTDSGVPSMSTKDTSFNGTSWWNYVKILAADNMEGRETGSPGLRKAQEYVVEQLKRAGLEPVGSASYYQPVRFECLSRKNRTDTNVLQFHVTADPLQLNAAHILN